MALYGVDYLAGVKYEKTMLATHPSGWAGGIFYWTFGNAKQTIRKMVKSKKFSEIVIHLVAFDNTHAYPIDKCLPIALSAARELEVIAKNNPSVSLMLSPFCEHNHSKKDMMPVFAQLRAVAPSCRMVNSIWKGQEVPETITEIHLENSKLKRRPRNDIYTVSFDGFGGDGSGDFTDTNIQKILDFYHDAKHIRLWNFRYNGKYGHKDTTPVNQRKNWPDEHYMKGHNAMMKKREGSVTYSGKALYKPFADDHGQGGKDNKAMCILPVKSPTVEVRDSKGKVIDIMKRVLPDHERGARYYSGKYAYQLADIAEYNTGSTLIKIANQPLTDADLRSSDFC